MTGQCQIDIGFWNNITQPMGRIMIIGIPIAWYVVDKWLTGYSYCIDNNVLPYTMAAVIISIVAILSITWQLIRLINTQPVNSLKKE